MSSGVDDKAVEAIYGDIMSVIEKRRNEYRIPGDLVYTHQSILCGLEIVRASVIADLTLIEQENRMR